MTTVIRKVPKLLRRLAGKGCQASDFAPVYSRAEHDAWGYSENSFEAARFALILDVLSGVSVGRALEVGCAEGHLTGRLAAHADELIACDIVHEALDRAALQCAGVANVRFLRADVREHWPQGRFDLLVFSDVLNYFSKAEVRKVLRDSAQRVGTGGYLLFANTWNNRWRWSTRPTYVIHQLVRSGSWETFRHRDHVDAPSGRSITIRLFRRRPLAESPVAASSSGSGPSVGGKSSVS